MATSKQPGDNARKSRARTEPKNPATAKIDRNPRPGAKGYELKREPARRKFTAGRQSADAPRTPPIDKGLDRNRQKQKAKAQRRR